ncbi:MAG: PIN domain nuclease [Candidatus Omnitrophica bacterium]|nr:PIN domain nuclease [Candidatus Omnitrophota bacterium]
MTSKSLKSVAADSNVLLSAVIGHAALKVFTRTNLEILTTEFNAGEVEDYLPFLGAKYHIDLKALWVQFKMLPVKIIGEDEYKSKLTQAKTYIGQRDMDDIPLAALALAKGIPIWSNDKDFENIPHLETYPTAKLLKSFDL